MQQTENLNVVSLDLMPSPDEVKGRHPLSEQAATTVVTARRAIEAILDGRDHRLLLVVGPCSIHDPLAGLDYARRLRTPLPGRAVISRRCSSPWWRKRQGIQPRC